MLFFTGKNNRIFLLIFLPKWKQSLIEQIAISVLRNDNDDLTSTDSGFQENYDFGR